MTNGGLKPTHELAHMVLAAGAKTKEFEGCVVTAPTGCDAFRMQTAQDRLTSLSFGTFLYTSTWGLINFLIRRHTHTTASRHLRQRFSNGGTTRGT